MVVDPKKLIAAIVPDVYCLKDKEKFGEITHVRDDVKEILKEGIKNEDKEVYLKAAEKAELVEAEFMDFDDVIKTPYKKSGTKNPIETHTMVYDVSGKSLEEIYFWLIDYLNRRQEYGSSEKLVDNFTAAPGSSLFTEIIGKATRMQEESIKMMGMVNTVVKSILNITYDLKDFRIRLKPYEDFKAGDKNAIFSLKQIWMDTVDLNRGNNSIKGLALSGTNAPNFVMLIDAFMVAKNEEDANKIDLNDRVKRILIQKLKEFDVWLRESEIELRKRFELEKSYLRSQVATLKLYSRWVRPYLKAAKQLEQNAVSPSTAILNAFNTAFFELVLLGVGEYNLGADIDYGDLPRFFKDKNKKGYNPIVIAELSFRTNLERSAQSQAIRGRLTATFTSFALNKEEVTLLKKEIERDDLKGVFDLIEGAAGESLNVMKDVDEFLEDSKKEGVKEKEGVDTNPFSALFSIFTPEKKKEEKPKKEDSIKLVPDDEYDEIIRSQAAIESRKKCQRLYNTFKKNYGGPAF